MGFPLSVIEKMGFEKKKKLVIDHNNTQLTETVGGKTCHFRSLLERNFAHYLEFLKTHHQIKDWAFEQTKFIFDKEIRGAKQFLVDFDILNNDGTFEYYETKGWLKGQDVTKFRRLSDYRPEVKITLVMSGRNKKDANRIREIEKYADRVVYAPDLFKPVRGVIKFLTKADLYLEA